LAAAPAVVVEDSELAEAPTVLKDA